MDELQELLDQHDYALPEVGDIRQGIIVAINQQGVIVDLGLKRDGLVPPSDIAKLEDEEREALQVNDEIFVYILNTDKPDSLIISIHLAKLNQDWIEAEELLDSGAIIQGEVIGYNKGGAIVPFGRLRGFIPISHLTDLSPGMGDRKRQQRMAKLRGEDIPLKVIEVNRRRRRLVFSQREAQKEWDAARRAELLAELNEGDIRTGIVSGLRDFGAFVNLGGADGLIHISELAWHRVDHPREVLKVGDEVEVYIMKIVRKTERISLSRKKVLPNPWDTVKERYDEGQLVEGLITRLVDYGAFAEIEPGIEGLLHLSQLSRGNIDKPGDVVQEGETHLLRIVNIDKKRQRMGLSLKAVTAMEQIEWMAQREIEKAAEDAAADMAAAKENHAAVIVDEVAGTVEESVTVEETAVGEKITIAEKTTVIEEAVAVEEPEPGDEITTITETTTVDEVVIVDEIIDGEEIITSTETIVTDEVVIVDEIVDGEEIVVIDKTTVVEETAEVDEIIDGEEVVVITDTTVTDEVVTVEDGGEITGIETTIVDEIAEVVVDDEVVTAEEIITAETAEIEEIEIIESSEEE
ncbi:MAG: S1 RNA-binding domain-containing protein [Anaerolineales bacterium]|nr:S1 RNA-binding domain-containing protein [Anaerolineales bacterium]